MKIFLSCFSAGSCVLLSFLLFFHPYKQNLKANKWLSLYMFIMGTSFVRFYLQETAEANLLNYLEPVINSLQFLLAPFIYASTLYFVHPAKKLRVKDITHLFPFFFYLLIIMYYNAGGFHADSIIHYLEILLPFQFSLYLIFSYLNLLQHKRNLEIVSSSTKGINLDWFKNFLIILMMLTVFWIISMFFSTPYLLDILPLLYTICVFICAHYAIKQKTIFQNTNAELIEISVLFTGNSKTHENKTQRFDEKQEAELFNNLQNLMEEEKLFLDSELTISKIAEKFGLSIHETSYLINKTTGSNFYNFVNQYRVKEVCKLLEDGKTEKLNLLGIAFEAGFNSKTTFNTTFKKWAGCTPTEYVSRLKNT